MTRVNIRRRLGNDLMIWIVPLVVIGMICVPLSARGVLLLTCSFIQAMSKLPPPLVASYVHE